MFRRHSGPVFNVVLRRWAARRIILDVLRRWGRRLRAEWVMIDEDTRRLALSFVIVVFGTCFALGFAWGWYNSPSYDSVGSAERFAAANFRWVEKNSADVELRVQAAHRVYTYSSRTATARRELLSPEIVAAIPIKKRRRYEEEQNLLAIAGLIAGPGGAVAATSSGIAVMSKFPPQLRAALGGVATIGGALGGWLGYRLAYHDEMDYDDRQFDEALANPYTWSAWAVELRDYLALEAQLRGKQSELMALQAEQFASISSSTNGDFHPLAPNKQNLVQMEVSSLEMQLRRARLVWQRHAARTSW